MNEGSCGRRHFAEGGDATLVPIVSQNPAPGKKKCWKKGSPWEKTISSAKILDTKYCCTYYGGP